MFSHIILEDNGVCPTSLIHALLFSSRFYYRIPADSVLDCTLNKLLELQSAHSEHFANAEINILLISMMLHLLNQNSADQLTFSSHQNSYVAYTLNYIEKKYMTKIRQTDIASQLQISVRYLSRLFKDYMGIRSLPILISIGSTVRSSLCRKQTLRLPKLPWPSGFLTPSTILKHS